MKESLIKQFISEDRFKSYENLEEYSNNLIFSQNAYIPLSILEVALRNALNNHLSEKISDIWYEEDFLTKDSIEKVSQAKSLLTKRRERTDKEKIIAELSFGFWVNLFKKPYDKKLRINDIKRIFQAIANISDFDIEVMKTDNDHVHLLIRYIPKLSISQIVRRLKQKSTEKIWKLYPILLRQEFWYQNIFWSEGYFVCSIGETSPDTICKYILSQG